MDLLRRLMAKGGRRGNVAVTFALLAPLLAVTAGGAIDVTDASMRQWQLQQAADAAAVGAVARSSPGYAYAQQMTTDGAVPNATTLANAQAIFTADWRSPGDSTVGAISGNASPCGASTLVCKSNNVVYSQVTATGTFKPSFLGLLSLVGVNNISAMPLKATSTAADNVPAYMNFYLLLDNTPSQGVAATTAGITALQNATGGCAFACHDVNNSNSNYNIAKNNNIATRINNVAAAAANLMTTAQTVENTNGISNEFTVGVLDFGTSSTNPQNTMPLSAVYPTQFGATTTNLSAAGSAAATIDLMTVQGNDANGDQDNDQYHDQDTGLNSVLNFAAQNLTSSGKGASSSSPQQVIFLVTDGVVDTYNCNYNDDGNNDCREIRPIDPTPCTTLKNKGFKIAILYTTYLPLPNNPWFVRHASWLTVNNPPPSGPTPISTALQSCATTGLFFEVNSSQDINTAMQKLFSSVLASVRITG